MRSLHIERSGIEQVWDGCEFSNGLVVGTWITSTPSYGYYGGVQELSNLYNHMLNVSIVIGENICSNGGSFLWLVTKNLTDLTPPECPWIAEGMRFRNGWICLIHLAKESPIYWHPSLQSLEMLYGERSHIIRDTSNIGYPKFDKSHFVWRRERIHLN